VADISKCKGQGCNIKNTCYRFLADADDYMQSYIKGNVSDDGEYCDHYWPDTEEAARDMKKKKKERKAS
jgi:hypothetical protein